MKGTQRAAVIAFLLMTIIGLGLPFWMEYKSLSNPPFNRNRDGSRGRATEIDPRRAYYCPACGGEISVPAWENAPENVRAPALSLKTWPGQGIDKKAAEAP